MPLIADQQRQAVLTHRGEMRPAGHQADIRAGARKLHTKITTDRAGAVDANLHPDPLESSSRKPFRFGLRTEAALAVTRVQTLGRGLRCHA
jgi:hypothetical protein